MNGDTRATTSQLGGLLEVTRLVRSEDDLTTFFERLARALKRSLGWDVVINLYREAWHDFVVAAVESAPEVRSALLGETYTYDSWEQVLIPRFERRGAFLIRAGEFDWSDMGARFVPEPPPGSRSDEAAWSPEDELFVPMRHTDGHLLGILNLSSPRSGRRPADDELDVLVAVGAHAAAAVQTAQEAAETVRHREALERLLKVSSQLAAKSSLDEVLRTIGEGIRDALGFTKVSIELVDPETGRLVPQAVVGWDAEEAIRASAPTVRGIMPLLDPLFEVGGCFLVPPEQATTRTGIQAAYRSELNGSGPLAWNRHWLIVPLHDQDGGIIGGIWADDPIDRLLPSRQRLQALRLFADQATTAITSARQVERLRFLAEHDPLTRLPNRRAFVRELEAEIARCRRTDRTFALVVCDLDDLKSLNDREGHQAGDEALRQVAAALLAASRSNDLVFRIGGDEFALLLPGADCRSAPRLQRRAAAELRRADHPGRLEASFGAAAFPRDGDNLDHLFRRADEALYRAKRSGQKVVTASP